MTSSGISEFPSFNPFIRHPTSVIGKIKMIICGSILLPIRATGAIITLTTGLVWCNICCIGCTDLSKPYSRLRRVLLQGGIRILSRILLFFYGFVWLYESHEIEDAQERAKQPHPSVIVVNHIGFAELMYLVYSDGCCFVSKEANRSLPFIGTISEVLQSIFVDRGDGKRKSMQPGSSHTSESSSAASGEDRDGEKIKSMQTGSSHTSESSSASGGNGGITKSTTEQILERARAPPGSYPPLCICPEGTTHTGHILIKFATGAFRSGLPVQPVIVQSPFSPLHGYDPSFSCANIVTHM